MRGRAAPAARMRRAAPGGPRANESVGRAALCAALALAGDAWPNASGDASPNASGYAWPNASGYTWPNASGNAWPNASGDEPRTGCNVSAPSRDVLGDCPSFLPPGGTCQPGCQEGYTPSGEVQCNNGSLSLVRCMPSPCNVSLSPEPENGEHGPQCLELEVLESGQSCEPVCNANWSLVSSSNCSLGTLIPGRCVRCAAGQTFNATSRSCQECSRGTYKAAAGNGPCLPCPQGSDTGHGGADTWSHCVCNSTTYRSEQQVGGGGGEPFACVPCPEHARVLDVPEARSVKECKCIEPYNKQVLNETTQQLLRCRMEYPCNLSALLIEINITGPEPWQLLLGTCAPYYSNGTGLPSRKACYLECRDGTAPQVKADLFTAVDRGVLCADGEVTGHPPAGTWCSEAAWTLPPLLFLIAVTVTAAGAMFNIERRQHRFEQSCCRALDNGIGRGRLGAGQGAKCKQA